jgi:hypothetical protein
VEYATKPLSTPTGDKIVPCSLKNGANTLRLEMSDSLLAIADEVVE